MEFIFSEKIYEEMRKNLSDLLNIYFEKKKNICEKSTVKRNHLMQSKMTVKSKKSKLQTPSNCHAEKYFVFFNNMWCVIVTE